MKKCLVITGVVVVVVAVAALSVTRTHAPVVNPDPNHTHADFAVWIDGKQLDFSGEEFMSGSSDENDPDHTKFDLYLHLHDGNGHVIHRHKPGLTIGQFFTSLGVTFTKQGNNLCMKVPGHPIACEDEALHRNWAFLVNGVRQPFFDTNAAFTDLDTILVVLPIETNDEQQLQAIQTYLLKMTNDACLYSKTCPERGDPPSENCIADPEVPCTQ